MHKEIIYGFHAVINILRKTPEKILNIWLQTSRNDNRSQEVMRLAQKAHVNVNVVERKTLDKLAQDVQHQGIIAEIKAAGILGENVLFDLLENLSKPALLLIIDSVQDPRNLGACMRSADAAGVQAVIVAKDKAVGLTPAVRKVACGAAESMPLIQVTNLARTMRALKQQGVWLVGAAGEAESVIYDIDLTGSVAIVVGAEEQGLRQLTRKECDYLAKLPMHGLVSSLNVSVATGILLFEAVRQRRN